MDHFSDDPGPFRDPLVVHPYTPDIIKIWATPLPKARVAEIDAACADATANKAIAAKGADQANYDNNPPVIEPIVQSQAQIQINLPLPQLQPQPQQRPPVRLEPHRVRSVQDEPPSTTYTPFQAIPDPPSVPSPMDPPSPFSSMSAAPISNPTSPFNSDSSANQPMRQQQQSIPLQVVMQQYPSRQQPVPQQPIQQQPTQQQPIQQQPIQQQPTQQQPIQQQPIQQQPIQQQPIQQQPIQQQPIQQQPIQQQPIQQQSIQQQPMQQQPIQQQPMQQQQQQSPLQSPIHHMPNQTLQPQQVLQQQRVQQQSPQHLPQQPVNQQALNQLHIPQQLQQQHQNVRISNTASSFLQQNQIPNTGGRQQQWHNNQVLSPLNPNPTCQLSCCAPPRQANFNQQPSLLPMAQNNINVSNLIQNQTNCQNMTYSSPAPAHVNSVEAPQFDVNRLTARYLMRPQMRPSILRNLGVQNNMQSNLVPVAHQNFNMPNYNQNYASQNLYNQQQAHRHQHQPMQQQQSPQQHQSNYTSNINQPSPIIEQNPSLVRQLSNTNDASTRNLGSSQLSPQPDHQPGILDPCPMPTFHASGNQQRANPQSLTNLQQIVSNFDQTRLDPGRGTRGGRRASETRRGQQQTIILPSSPSGLQDARPSPVITTTESSSAPAARAMPPVSVSSTTQQSVASISCEVECQTDPCIGMHNKATQCKDPPVLISTGVGMDGPIMVEAACQTDDLPLAIMGPPDKKVQGDELVRSKVEMVDRASSPVNFPAGLKFKKRPFRKARLQAVAEQHNCESSTTSEYDSDDEKNSPVKAAKMSRDK